MQRHGHYHDHNHGHGHDQDQLTMTMTMTMTMPKKKKKKRELSHMKSIKHPTFTPPPSSFAANGLCFGLQNCHMVHGILVHSWCIFVQYLVCLVFNLTLVLYVVPRCIFVHYLVCLVFGICPLYDVFDICLCLVRIYICVWRVFVHYLVCLVCCVLASVAHKALLL